MSASRCFALAALLGACGGDEVRLLTTTLDRPVAVAFVCADADDEIMDSTRCEGEGGTLWALLANSSRGEVGLAKITDARNEERMTDKDLDPASPGVQLLAAGTQITDLAIGPFAEAPLPAMTANYGSCDLGLIDVQELLHAPATAPVVSRVVPQKAGMRLGARPRAVAFVPGSRTQAYALFPGCGLLARLDLASGEILDALSITVASDGSGRAELVADPRCPAECPGLGSGCVGACPDTALPSDLDVADDGATLVVSAAGASFLTVVGLVDGALAFPSVVPLEGGTATDRVRISPSTRYGRFAYAAARDGSVRVVSVERPLVGAHECETNPDPRAFTESQDIGCVPIGTQRRPASLGPGIDLPDQALPVDIVFRDEPATGTVGGGRYMDGVFAFVLQSDGQVSVVDVEDRRYPDAIPHAIRSELVRSPDSEGEYRLPAPVVVMSLDPSVEWPERQLGPVDEIAEPPADRYPTLLEDGVRFFDPLRTPSGEVGMVFLGVLPDTSRASGVLLDPVVPDEDKEKDTGPCPERSCLYDPGAAFCSKGVEEKDRVEIVGCFSNADCRSGVEACHRDPQAPVDLGGLCVCDGDADPDADQCLDSDLEVEVEEEEGVRAKTVDCRPLTVARDDYVINRATSTFLELEDPPPARCFPSRVRYRVRAGDALLLTGTDFVHRIIAPDVDGPCAVDPSKSPLLQSKIALTPPLCTDSALPAPNPCLTRGLVRFGHPLHDLTFERMDDPPEIEPGWVFSISFVVEGSFDPEAVDSQAFLPAAIEMGPDGLIYVVDQGDEIGGTARGRLLRMDPIDLELDTEFFVR